MDDRDKKLIIARYAERLKQYGVDIKALASGNRERQRIRFGILSKVGDLNGYSVLDVGCGFGDFYAYLKEQGIKVDYTGIDICPPLIEVCKERFPEAAFSVIDIQTDHIVGPSDYIISSQTFNNKLEHDGNEQVMREVLTRSYDLCRKGVAIDMLTSYVDFKEDHLHYYTPEEIFSFCKTLTKRVTLKHDYPLFEFTMYLYKDFQGWTGIS